MWNKKLSKGMPRPRSSILSFFKGLDKRFKVVLGSIGIYNWSSNLSLNYNQLYAVALGANPVELGSLNSFGSVVSSAISIPAGWLIDRHGVKKTLILGLVTYIVVSAIYGFATSWLMLLPAVMLIPVGFKLVIPLADLIFVSTSGPTNRAQLMGLSRVIWSISSLLAPMVSAIIVAMCGGLTVEGIRPLYFIQLLSILATTFFIVLTLEELRTQPVLYGNERSIKDDLLKSLKDLLGERSLRKWMLLMGLWRLGISISMSFIPLWMVYAKGADPYILGAVSTIGLLTSILLQIPVGMMADRIGRKKTFLLTRPLTYLGTILLVIAPDPQTLMLVGFLGALGLMGGFSDISFTPFITMFWEAVPLEKRGRWFGLTGIFDILSVPAFLLGGLLWQEGLEELVLILPLLIEIFAIIPFTLILPETLRPSNAE